MKDYPQVRIYNPLTTDFSTTYDINDTGTPERYTLHAGEIESFPKPVAEHIIKHLGYQIAVARRGQGTYDLAFEKARKLIAVDDEITAG